MRSTVQSLSTTLLTILAGLILVWCSGIHAVAGTPSEQDRRGLTSGGFQLEAALAQPVVAVGEPITLRLVCRNVTGVPLISWQAVCWLSLRDSSGNEIPMRLRSEVEIDVSMTRIAVPPGGESVLEYPVSEMYDLSTVGEYEITANRRVLRLDGEGLADAVSNTVVLTVSDNPQNAQATAAPNLTSENRKTAKSLDASAKPRLVAVRPILQRHGCRLTWDASMGEATVSTANGQRAIIRANSDVLVVGSGEMKMWSPAKVVNGRLHAPGDAISQIVWLCAG